MRRKSTAWQFMAPERRAAQGSVCLTFALFLVLTLLPATPATATEDDARKLTAPEITALLSGRTALGEHRGTATRQYFDPAGWTDYLAEGSPPDRGKWRVDAGRDQYCSQWGAFGGWSCYDVTTDGLRYYWSLPGEDDRSPFTTVDGHKMTF